MGNNAKYPGVYVELINQDGNAFSILGRVSKALRAAKVSREEIDLFMKDAMSGNYNHLLCVVMNWVNVGDPYDEDDESDEEDSDECFYCGEIGENCTCDEDDDYEDEQEFDYTGNL